MARRAFVQGQRGQGIERARGQVERVDQIDARAAAPRRVIGRDGIGHGHDGKAAARQVAEPFGGLGVEFLGDPRPAIEQGLRRLDVELRIGAQEMQEGRQVTLEMHVLHHLLHLRADLRHGVQPDLVNLRRGRSSVVYSRICAW
jgi:hypothetical protein